MNVLEELRAEKAKPLREIYEECREEDIYNQGYMMDMLDDDQISGEEAGFMLGYHSA